MDNNTPIVITTRPKDITHLGHCDLDSIKEAIGAHKYAITSETMNGVNIPQHRYIRLQRPIIINAQSKYVCFI